MNNRITSLTSQLPNFSARPVRQINRFNRRNHYLQVFIVSSTEGDTSFFAAVIYRGNQRIHCFEGWLDNTSAERAWLHALSLCFEWRDSHAPDARLFIRNADDQEAKKAA